MTLSEQSFNPLDTAERLVAELGGLVEMETLEIIRIVDGLFVVNATSKEKNVE